MAMLPNAPPGPPMDPMGMPQMPMEQPQQAGDTEMLVAELAQHAGRVREIMSQLSARGIDVEQALESAVAVQPGAVMPQPLGEVPVIPEEGLGGNTGLPAGLLEGMV